MFFRGDVSNFSVVGSGRQKTRPGVGEGGRTFSTCTRRRSELKNIHRGTFRCDGEVSFKVKAYIWETLF